MSTFGKCNGGGRRSAARGAAPLIAVFTTRTRSCAAELVDVSATGARLRGRDLPAEGEAFLLAVEGVRAFATVVWSSRDDCGVEFELPLPAERVQFLHQKVSMKDPTLFTAEERAALEEWAIGTAR